jgi:hypothetical protein
LIFTFLGNLQLKFKRVSGYVATTFQYRPKTATRRSRWSYPGPIDSSGCDNFASCHNQAVPGIVQGDKQSRSLGLVFGFEAVEGLGGVVKGVVNAFAAKG